MSASIRWSLTSNGKSLDVWSPDDFLGAMGRVFGDGPWTLGEGSLSVLRGMAAVDKNRHNGYGDLIRIIETHGEVKVWAV